MNIYKFSKKIHYLALSELFPSVPRLFRNDTESSFAPQEFVTQEHKLVPYFINYAAPGTEENIQKVMAYLNNKYAIY